MGVHRTLGVTGRKATEPPLAGQDDESPLTEQEFREIYAKVPRLTVEVVVQSPLGILLTKRAAGPCSGLWHIPGGTVRFGEPLVSAVSRVAGTELGLELEVGSLLGYIEYPSHYLNGLDSPVGLAFFCNVSHDQVADAGLARTWFTRPPDPMHVEQVDFLTAHGLLISDR
ncbi:MAG TPA: NUDIX domain-containing protein [Acidimicrobiales bacterium]|nr:NUDIX domain-containing protein [Acidimicrobiales bacterium]